MPWILDHPVAAVLLVTVCALAVVFIHDVTQKQHAILHNFPVVGHLRYLFEDIGPELRQYWVANDKEEQPFNRSERAWVYASAKGQKNDFGFGTSEVIYGIGYPILKHATFPYENPKRREPGHDASYACLLYTSDAADE